MASYTTMMKPGSKRNILRVFIPEVASGTETGKGDTALANTDVAMYYLREGSATPVAITDAAGVVGTWSSGGFIKIDDTNMPGLYEIGLPDAMVAKGAKWVDLLIKGPAGAGDVHVHILLPRSVAF